MTQCYRKQQSRDQPTRGRTVLRIFVSSGDMTNVHTWVNSINTYFSKNKETKNKFCLS